MGLSTALLLVATSQMGCALGDFGRANTTAFDINVPSGLLGQNKEAIMRTLGVPDNTVTAGGVEYWGYRNHNGWAVQFSYLTFGKAKAKDLVLEFAGGKVRSSYLIDKGSSLGIIATPLYVAQ